MLKVKIKTNNKINPLYLLFNLNILFIFFGVLLVTLFFLNVPSSLAQSFVVGTTICKTEWYCTNYSEITCGTRQCLDQNSCNNNYQKPQEYIACPEPEPTEQTGSSSGGGGGGDGGASFYFPPDIEDSPTQTPVDFELSSDFENIEILEEDSSTDNIIIKADNNQSLAMEIAYPPDYKGPKDLVQLLNNNFIVKKDESVELPYIIDSSKVQPGTYTIPISITSQNSKQTVLVVVNVNQKSSNIDLDITIPKIEKEIEAGNSLDFSFAFDNLPKENNGIVVTYTLFDKRGVMFASAGKTFKIDDEKKIAASLNMPKNLTAGYYFLSVSLKAGNFTKSSVVQFSVIPKEQFSKVEEKLSPGKSGNIARIWEYLSSINLYTYLILSTILILGASIIFLLKHPWPHSKKIIKRKYETDELFEDTKQRSKKH